MMHPHTMFLAVALAAAASAQDTVKISLGIRETAAGSGTFTNIGDNGGSSGGIEWVNRDGQTLKLDGTWQQFTFTLATDPLIAFAGTTANGMLDGAFGVIEHIRILNDTGITEPMAIWIDDVANTLTGPVTTTFGTFENYPQGTEVMFQEPSFSGSTSANLVAGSTAGVDNFFTGRMAVYKTRFQFVDNTPTRWLRLTTFNATNQPNPLIRFDQGSVVTFWLKGAICQENLGSQGPGTAVAELCGVGLNANERSTYTVIGAPPGAQGALGISRSGQMDLKLFGGTVVSGAGLITTIPLFVGRSGTLSFNVPGSPVMTDFVLQSVFIDSSLPSGVAFTNAMRARFGQ